MPEPDTNYAAGIEIGTPPGSFQKLARTATFTFQMRAPAQSGSLKRPKSHPDAPTPNASPEKKRTQVIERDRTPPPPFDLWREPPPSSTSLPQNSPPLQSSSPVDVFGGNSTIPSPRKSSSLGSKLLSAQSKIKTFFKVATRGEIDAARAREAEERNASREMREEEQKYAKFAAETKTRAAATQRKREQRARDYEMKVASGWVPAHAGRKRVSIILLLFVAALIVFRSDRNWKCSMILPSSPKSPKIRDRNANSKRTRGKQTSRPGGNSCPRMRRRTRSRLTGRIP